MSAVERGNESCSSEGRLHASESIISDQPPPISNNHPAIADLVIADMARRKRVGIERYGVPLQPFNGRNALIDAYQEVLDLTVYLRQRLEEDDWEVRQLQIIESIVSGREALCQPECEYITKIVREILSKRQICNGCGNGQERGDRVQLDLLGDAQ